MKLTAILRKTERLREIGERVLKRMRAFTERDVRTDAPWIVVAKPWSGAVPARAVVRARVRR